MNTAYTITKKHMGVAVAAVVFLSVCVIGFTMHDADRSDAAYSGYGQIYEINLAPGFSYSYVPSYPSDLSVTTSIEKYESEGIDASFSNKTLTVTVKNGITDGSYDIILKAVSDTGGVAQEAKQHIRINVVSGLSVSGSINNIIQGTSVDFAPNGSSSMGTVTWAVKSGTTLPAGLSLDKSTGKVTGTPTKLGTNTVSLTATAAGQTKDLVVSFTVYSKIAGGSAETVYSHGNTVGSAAIGNASDIKVTWKVTSGTLPAGFSLDASTGVISGSSVVRQSSAVTVTGTSGAGPTQTATKVITINSEPNLAISGGSSVVTFAGAGDRTLQLTATAGTSAVTWSVSSHDGVSIGSSGLLTVKDTAAAGNVTVTAKTAYGGTATKTISVGREAVATVTGADSLGAVAGSSASAVFSCSMAGTWSVDSSAAPVGVTVTMTGGSLVVSGSSPTAPFDVTVRCVTPGGQTATKSVTCQIASALIFSSVPSVGVIAYEG